MPLIYRGRRFDWVRSRGSGVMLLTLAHCYNACACVVFWWHPLGAKVLVVPFGMCWSLDVSSSLVVVMGTESYDGREHKYVDYPVTDLLHMTGLASR